MTDVQKMGERLQSYPFVTDWWKQEPANIRIRTNYTAWQRAKWALAWLNPWKTRRSLKFDDDKPLVWRFGMVWFSWKEAKYDSVDDVLGGDNYFTWGENADYMVMVQPKVGEVIGQFLIDEPDHPHAIKIAKAVQEALNNAIN